ncbi:MAG: hypothetical protein FJ148_12445 [Deltaproteobacteria bacterium]|nr:hypothetical protein [Deltaproteobacteria bacterium]
MRTCTARRRPCPSRIRALLWVAVLGLALSPSAASAQLSSAASSNAGSTCSGANNSDGFCGSSTSIPTNNGTTFQSRYAWNVNADVGIGSTRDTSGNAQHNMSFNATAAGGYRLDIATQRQGDMNRLNDAAGCSGSSDIGALTGSSNVALSSGTLSLVDPGGIGTGGSTTSTPFNQTSSATIAA